MKLLAFLKKDCPHCQASKAFFDSIATGNLLRGVGEETLREVPERFLSAVDLTELEICNRDSKDAPIRINYYNIKKYPTLILLNNECEMIRWETRMPTKTELIFAIKNYMLINELSYPEIDFDIDD